MCDVRGCCCACVRALLRGRPAVLCVRLRVCLPVRVRVSLCTRACVCVSASMLAACVLHMSPSQRVRTRKTHVRTGHYANEQQSPTG